MTLQDAMDRAIGERTVNLLADLPPTPFAPPLPAEGSHPVIRPFISQFSQVQEHLFQGSSLLPRVDRFRTESSGEPGGEVIERAWRTPLGFAYAGIACSPKSRWMNFKFRSFQRKRAASSWEDSLQK